MHGRLRRGTHALVTTVTGISAQDSHGADFAEAIKAVRADDNIQFAPVEAPPPRETPEWLRSVMEFLENLFRPVAELLGISWPVLKWVLLGIGTLALLFLLWRLIAPAISLRKHKAEQEDTAWMPDQGAVIALLEDADRLAAEGRFDEATHLLLQRSVSHIAEARPGWLEPSSTAREIARLPALPEAARAAFATIAERVERALYALRPLAQEDWQTARAAYSDFALADLERSA